MSKDIKKALEHCIEWNCADCPNREELGSGETVCRGRLLPYVLEYVSDLEAKLADLQQEQVKEMQEHQEAMELADKTITNLVEDNRASQEWYKKQLAESESRFQAHKQNDARIIQDQTDLIENLKQQLADTEEQNKRVLEKLELIVSANQELEQKLAESFTEKDVEGLIKDREETIKFLKQQLAEKESEADQRYKDWQEEIRECDGLRVVLSEVRKQLAEKDKAIENWQTMYESVMQTCHNDKEEIKRLKQQLAEKEKEISNLKGLVNERDKQIKNLKTNKKRVVEHKNKVKISFAVEQLEKVKELVEEKGAISSPFGNLKIQASDVSVIIDNQIKAIKEMK